MTLQEVLLKLTDLSDERVRLKNRLAENLNESGRLRDLIDADFILSVKRAHDAGLLPSLVKAAENGEALENLLAHL